MDLQPESYYTLPGLGKMTDPVGFSIKHADAINADGASSCFLDSCESEASRDLHLTSRF